MTSTPYLISRLNVMTGCLEPVVGPPPADGFWEGYAPTPGVLVGIGDSPESALNEAVESGRLTERGHYLVSTGNESQILTVHTDGHVGVGL